MLKLAAASLIGLAVVGWLVAGPDQAFDNRPTPPTIRAEPGPIKYRPESYVAGHNQPRATPITIRQVAPDDASAIDVNLILAR
jgi:hypothetical protein